jgi:hypothetical protein
MLDNLLSISCDQCVMVQDKIKPAMQQGWVSGDDEVISVAEGERSPFLKGHCHVIIVA